MKLEQTVKTYGMNDYYDMNTGYTYELSKAIDNNDGTLKVPVKDSGILIGYSTMKKVED